MNTSLPAARVLIVEDDATMLRGLVDNFRDEQYEVYSAQDGQAAMQQAIALRPDLVVLDIMLPRANGFEVCYELRHRGCDATIIMLTAKGHEADIVRGLELGADDYVTKPFSVRELMARCRAFLRRRRHPDAIQRQFGPFTLDQDAHCLRRHGDAIELTSKEYRLLEYFLLHSGLALTRNDILDAVWGRSIVVTDRSVDRCVTTLRGKIEDDPRHPRWIHTIRDVGYRFADEDLES